MIILALLILVCLYLGARGQRPTRGSYVCPQPPEGRPIVPPRISAPAAKDRS